MVVPTKMIYLQQFIIVAGGTLPDNGVKQDIHATTNNTTASPLTATDLNFKQPAHNNRHLHNKLTSSNGHSGATKAVPTPHHHKDVFQEKFGKAQEVTMACSEVAQFCLSVSSLA